LLAHQGNLAQSQYGSPAVGTASAFHALQMDIGSMTRQRVGQQGFSTVLVGRVPIMSTVKFGVMVLGIGLFGSGAAYLLASGGSQERKDSSSASNAEKEASLRKAIVEDAGKVYDLTLKWHNEGGPVSFEDLNRWSVRWLEAELDLAKDADAKTTALKAHLERTKEAETQAVERSKMGVGRVSDPAGCRYFRAQAELWLAHGGMITH
jgi:hypothetical protein